MTKLQIKVRRGYMYYLKKTKCLCSWNLHSVLFLMQPEAMGDVEVNSAFYNVSCSLWRVLVWHALLLEWIPNWGLKSGVPLQIVVMFLDTDVVLPNYYWILKKTTKTKKKKITIQTIVLFWYPEGAQVWSHLSEVLWQLYLCSMEPQSQYECSILTTLQKSVLISK